MHVFIFIKAQFLLYILAFCKGILQSKLILLTLSTGCCSYQGDKKAHLESFLHLSPVYINIISHVTKYGWITAWSYQAQACKMSLKETLNDHKEMQNDHKEMTNNYKETHYNNAT